MKQEQTEIQKYKAATVNIIQSMSDLEHLKTMMKLASRLIVKEPIAKQTA